MTRATQRGMTLVELLVAMTIGLAVTVVVTTLLVASENHKRTTTSTNDAVQTGNYAFYALDRALRGAGSGIAESAFPKDAGVLGCLLNVKSILPRTTAFPAPFSGFPTGAANALHVAPVLIGQGLSDGGLAVPGLTQTTSDALVVMGGSGAAGGVSRPVNGAGDSTTLILENTIGFSASDVALVSQSGITDCLMEQVHGTPSATNLTLASGDTYYISSGTATSLSTLAGSLSSYVTPLGNPQANTVQFQMFGVGTDNTLYSYDLLKANGIDLSQGIADGVVALNAIYGVQVTAAPGVLDHWVSPSAAGYDIKTVMTTPATIESIIAVHVALVVRGEYYDKNLSNAEGLPTQVTIFNGYKDGSGNPLSQIITLPLGTNYRYRLFEFTVPLRNMLILAGA